jgi:hypothetical protein
VLLAVNMQTSFMHPPFGFALFYLRSVAPSKEFIDRLTGRRTAPVTTGQIYWGAVPFVLIQIIMVALIIAFPDIVSGGLGTKAKVDTQNIRIEVPLEEAAPAGESGGAAEEQEDVRKALERSMGGGDKGADTGAEKGADKAPQPAGTAPEVKK